MLDNQSTLTSCVTRYAAFDHTVLAIGPECCSTEPFTSVWPVIRLLNSQTALRLRNRRVQSRGPRSRIGFRLVGVRRVSNPVRPSDAGGRASAAAARIDGTRRARPLDPYLEASLAPTLRGGDWGSPANNHASSTPVASAIRNANSSVRGSFCNSMDWMVRAARSTRSPICC